MHLNTTKVTVGREQLRGLGIKESNGPMIWCSHELQQANIMSIFRNKWKSTIVTWGSLRVKEYQQEAPILRYSDPEANYTLYTDGLKYPYAGVFTQTIEDTDHPVAYVTRLLAIK